MLWLALPPTFPNRLELSCPDELEDAVCAKATPAEFSTRAAQSRIGFGFIISRDLFVADEGRQASLATQLL